MNRFFLCCLLTQASSFSISAESVKNHSGFLCAIEGIDGAGKTTLLKKLEEKFKATDQKVIFTREPGATSLGQKIRSLLVEQSGQKDKQAEYLLFAADRAQHFAQKIIPHLSQGFIVISDRMADSSLAYQGYVKGVDIDMIKTINAWCMHGIQPDLVIYLKISPQLAKQRIATTRGIQTEFEQEYLDRIQTLYDAFETIFANRSNVLIVDATAHSDLIAQQVFDAIVQLSENCSSGCVTPQSL